MVILVTLEKVRALAILVSLGTAVMISYRAATGLQGIEISPPMMPYQFDASAAPALLQLIRNDTLRHGQYVVIYTREDCIFSQAELRHWDTLLAATDWDNPSAELIVISSDSGKLTGAPLVSPRLAHRRVYDLDGRIGRELGVNVVPFTVYVDADGVVHANTVGVTDPASIRVNLELMRGGNIQ